MVMKASLGLCRLLLLTLNPDAMKITKYFFILMLILSAVSANAQSGNILTQTRTWHSEAGYDVTTSDSLSAVMRFVTVSADRIEHRNHNNVLQTFDVVSTEGSWTNIALEGSMTYHVSHTGMEGTIKVERTTAGVFLTIDFSNPETGGVKIKYIINQVE